MELSEALLPDAPPEAILREIIEKYMVEELVIDMKYGSACCLSANDLQGRPRAALEWLLASKIAAKI